MQPRFPTLSAFVDFLFDNDLITVGLHARAGAPWGGIPFPQSQVVKEFSEAIKISAGAGPWIAFKPDGSYGKKSYWEQKAPGVATIIGTGGLFQGSKSAVRWEAFCTEDGEFISANLRSIPLPLNPFNPNPLITTTEMQQLS